MASVNSPSTDRLITPARLRDGAGLPAWALAAAREFERRVCDDASPFPCHFARFALTSGALRFTFMDDAAERRSLDAFADALHAYVALARDLPGHTSLVTFVADRAGHASVEGYQRWFWGLLEHLRARDPEPWPDHVPRDPEDALWEFCFAGTPLFVLGSGPAYRRRASRRAGVVTIAFQPRFVFDRAFPDPAAYDRACRTIRRRLERYDDGQPVHPSLGAYRDRDAREWRQYVVPDTNDEHWDRCPLSPGGDDAALAPTSDAIAAPVPQLARGAAS
jgi:uncharacterized protein